MENQIVANKKIIQHPLKKLTRDAIKLGKKKDFIHGLIEVDIFYLREKIRKIKRETGGKVSITSLFIKSVDQALKTDETLLSMKGFGNNLYMFDETDVFLPVEVKVGNSNLLVPKIIRKIDSKTSTEIEREIEEHKNNTENYYSGQTKLFLTLPSFIRHLFYGAIMKFPQMFKEYFGNIMISNVSAFGMGRGWGIGIPFHTMAIYMGQIFYKKIKDEEHPVMCLTISVDHNIIDGAQATRFARRLKFVIESER